jgi:hypothetical protein
MHKYASRWITKTINFIRYIDWIMMVILLGYAELSIIYLFIIKVATNKHFGLTSDFEP